MLMMMGTHSGAGKHFLLSGLARILSDEGICLLPFKGLCFDQALYTTRTGSLMTPSQAIQSIAARVEATARASPVICHPKGIVIDGVLKASSAIPSLDEIKSIATTAARSIPGRILAEGGGSPAEFSISDDVPNIFVARLLEPHIVLVGDMFAGGAFAHIKGTLDLMPPDVRERVAGIILNRALLRGDEREFWLAVIGRDVRDLRRIRANRRASRCRPPAPRRRSSFRS